VVLLALGLAACTGVSSQGKAEEQTVKAPPGKCGGLLSGDCNAADFDNNGPNPVNFPFETVCTTAAACVVGNAGTEDKVFQAYCDSNYRTSCRQCNNDCSIGNTCEAKFDDAASNGLSISNCAVVAAPAGCAAPKVGCRCQPTVAAAGKIDCDCGCR
jgi:hypothetical protein